MSFLGQAMVSATTPSVSKELTLTTPTVVSLSFLTLQSQNGIVISKYKVV